MAILIFVYAMISLALYLTLAILLYKSSVSGTSMTNKPTAAATPGDDVKAELKEEAKQEENEYVVREYESYFTKLKFLGISASSAL